MKDFSVYVTNKGGYRIARAGAVIESDVVHRMGFHNLLYNFSELRVKNMIAYFLDEEGYSYPAMDEGLIVFKRFLNEALGD